MEFSVLFDISYKMNNQINVHLVLQLDSLSSFAFHIMKERNNILSIYYYKQYNYVQCTYVVKTCSRKTELLEHYTAYLDFQ